MENCEICNKEILSYEPRLMYKIDKDTKLHFCEKHKGTEEVRKHIFNALMKSGACADCLCSCEVGKGELYGRNISNMENV